MLFPISIVFWLCGLGLAYTFVGYPVHIFLLSRRCRIARRRPEISGVKPFVSVVLVVRNEQARVISRVNNLLSSDYPRDRLEIIIVSDGSEDDTAALARSLCEDSTLRIIEKREQRGKPACLNDGVASARGDIVVFADARQRFDADAIGQLAVCFNDPAIGAVSGELLIESAATGLGSSVDSYWKLEKSIRKAESQVDSCIGCTGAIYAIRKHLYQALPADTLLDDVVTPMLIAVSGHRVIFNESARAYDPQSLEPERESIRKRRTLAGNFQMLLRYPAWLLPSRNRLWWKLWAHKYLRLLAPFLLVTLFAANVCLLSAAPFYAAVFSAQLMFYAAAAIGILVPDLRMKVFCFPAGFVFLNLMTLKGLVYYVSLKGKRGW
jgi:cellulose synthase/poly-beta-1,6-N-acetylglucosamine synthase-like glycosyltransferase